MSAVAIVALALCAGCADSRQPLTATAIRMYGPGELGVGSPFRDFAFRTADGALTRLSAVRGRVTVLVFPSDPEWPSCEELQRWADLTWRRSVYLVDVVVVSVGEPGRDCEQALGRGLECDADARRVVLVCDPHGTIAPLYGAAARGHYYVLTNFLEIDAVGDLADEDQLEADVRRLALEIYDQDRRQGTHDVFRDW